MTTLPHESDLELLGLKIESGGRRAAFTLVPNIARHDGALYGGTSIAVSVVMMEAATRQGALWITTQYIAPAQQGDVISCEADVLAAGRHLAQVQVIGRRGDQIIFVSVGSTAIPREGGLEGQYQLMPKVTPPEEFKPMVFGSRGPDGFQGFTEQVEYRMARRVGDDGPNAPTLAMWVRLRDDRPVTAATLAFMADMVPGAIARSAGLIGGGASLDNSLRFGRIPDGQKWVLLDLKGQMSVGSHGHGSVSVWSPEGNLLAVGGQSANMVNAVTEEEFEMGSPFFESPERTDE